MYTPLVFGLHILMSYNAKGFSGAKGALMVWVNLAEKIMKVFWELTKFVVDLVLGLIPF